MVLQDHCQKNEREKRDPLRESDTSTVMRVILPALRNYSSWLMTNVRSSTFDAGDANYCAFVTYLWKTYAESLTLLKSVLPISELKKAPVVDYLLDEDEDTLGFKPIHNEYTRRRYSQGGADDPKPRCVHQEVSVEHVDKEKTSRIRDLITDGLLILHQKVVMDGLVICSADHKPRMSQSPSSFPMETLSLLENVVHPKSPKESSQQQVLLPRKSRTFLRLYFLLCPGTLTTLLFHQSKDIVDSFGSEEWGRYHHRFGE